MVHLPIIHVLDLYGKCPSIFQRMLFAPYGMVYRHPYDPLRTLWKIQVGKYTSHMDPTGMRPVVLSKWMK